MTKEYRDGALGALKAGDTIFYADVPEAGTSGSVTVKEADVLRGWEVEFGRFVTLKTNLPGISGDIILDLKDTKKEVLGNPIGVLDGKRVVSTSREQCVRCVILRMKKRASGLKDEMSSIRDRISEIRRQIKDFKKANTA